MFLQLVNQYKEAEFLASREDFLGQRICNMPMSVFAHGSQDIRPSGWTKVTFLEEHVGFSAAMVLCNKVGSNATSLDWAIKFLALSTRLESNLTP